MSAGLGNVMAQASARDWIALAWAYLLGVVGALLAALGAVLGA